MNSKTARTSILSALASLALATLALATLALAAQAASAQAASAQATGPAQATRPSFLVPPTAAELARIAPHPRLFSSTARFATLRSQSDPVSEQLLALLKRDADLKLAAPPITFPATGFLMGPMRQVQGRILSLSFQYRITGDKRYFDKAREDLLAIAALPEWRPSHFLDVGEAALAAAVGLDWLHDDLSEADREVITRAIVRNAILPSFEVADGPQSWLRGDFNWTQVCHGGVSVAALAIAEREPELARRVLERAILNFDRVGATYAPDGSHPEGPGYWSYGTGFHVILADALRTSLGRSFGLDEFPGFLATADFANQVVGPSGRGFNYSDSGDENPAEDPIMIWFARQRRDRNVAGPKLAAIARAAAAAADTKSDPPKRVSTSRHLALELLWWDPTLAATSSSLPLHWTAGGVQPLGIMRSSWNDPNASFLAIKGGTPDHSHGHMDVGGFILEADGVRWAIELGGENYNKMREAKLDLWNYTQDSDRWSTFRPGPEAHNILRLNNARQEVAGHAGISPLPPAADGSFGNVVDLTPLYGSQATKVLRTATLHADRTMTLRDTWTLRGSPAVASFQWLTRAKVTRTATGLRLEQSGQHLDLLFSLPESATVAIEDVSQPRALQDSSNPGVTRIVISRPTPPNTTASLTLRIIPGTVNPQPPESSRP